MSRSRDPRRRLGPNYWRVLSASGAANVADGMFQVALGLYAVTLTHSPALVAGAVFAARLPWLVLALPAGAWADRHDRLATMRRMQFARVVLLGILAAIVAADLGSMVVLYAVAVGLGAAEVLFDTAAQTLMPSLVDRDDLSRANGRLFAAELVGNQLAGPPLGGFVFALGAALAFGSEAGLYAVAAAVLLFVRGSYRSERTGPRQTLLTDIGEGLRFLLGHRVLRTLALVLGVQNLLNTATMAIFVLYAVSRDGLGLSSFGVGLVLTSGAFGGLVGSLVASRLEASVGRARLLVIAVVVLAGATAVPGITTNIVAVCASFVISALFGVAWNVVTVSLRQRIIPNAMLGRVNSGYRMVGWGTMPIGAALGGLIGQVLGLRAVFLLAGAGTLACVVPLLAGAKESDIALAEAATPGTL